MRLATRTCGRRRPKPKPLPFGHECRPLTAALRAWLHASPRHTHALLWRVRVDGVERTKYRTARLADATAWCTAHALPAPVTDGAKGGA